MKKILLAIAIIMLLLILLVALAPGFFTRQVGAILKGQAEKQLNAQVHFDRLDLSLIKEFPRLRVSLDSLRLIPRPPLSQDTLVRICRISLAVDLVRFFRHDKISIKAIEVVAPVLNLVRNRQGQGNWQILKTAAATDTTASRMGFELQSYRIVDATISFTDSAKDSRVRLEGLSHQGSGNFSAQQFVLTTKTAIPKAGVRLNGMTYLSEAELAADLNVAVDLDRQHFQLRENSVRINRVLLHFDGWFAQQNGQPQLDITFNSPQTDFKQILSLIPVLYKNRFNDLDADGLMAINGRVHGAMGEGILPAFEINVDVNDGAFGYRGQAARMEDVRLDLAVNNKGTKTDDVVVDLRSMHFKLNGQPVEMALQLKNPVSRPWVHTTVKGILDLAQLAQLIDLPSSTTLRGRIDTDLTLQGLVAKEQLGQLDGNGYLKVQQLHYAGPALPQPLQISDALVKVNPPRIRLDHFTATMGKSDLTAAGDLENPLGFLFSRQSLNGTLTVKSHLLDLDPFIEGPSSGLQAFELPDLVHLDLKAEFDRVLMQGMEFADVSGDLLVDKQVLHLNHLQADFAQGRLQADGSYRWIPPARPLLDFNFKAAALQIGGLLQITLPAKLAPFLKDLQGSVDGLFQVNTPMDITLMPILEQFFHRGDLSIAQVAVANTPLLKKLVDATRIERLRSPTLKNLNPHYTIQDGRFNLRPLNFTLGDYTFSLVGSHGLDLSLEYSLTARIPTESAEAKLNPLLSQYLQSSGSLLKGGTLDMDIAISGTAPDPKFSTRIARTLGDTLKQVVKTEAEKRLGLDSLKQQAQDKVQTTKDSLANRAKDALKDILQGRKKKTP